ncbi:hypothetical protein Efla_002186 [Eimeria flavescens]
MFFVAERFFSVIWMLNDDNPDMSMLELICGRETSKATRGAPDPQQQQTESEAATPTPTATVTSSSSSGSSRPTLTVSSSSSSSSSSSVAESPSRYDEMESPQALASRMQVQHQSVAMLNRAPSRSNSSSSSHSLTDLPLLPAAPAAAAAAAAVGPVVRHTQSDDWPSGPSCSSSASAVALRCRHTSKAAAALGSAAARDAVKHCSSTQQQQQQQQQRQVGGLEFSMKVRRVKRHTVSSHLPLIQESLQQQHLEASAAASARQHWQLQLQGHAGSPIHQQQQQQEQRKQQRRGQRGHAHMLQQLHSSSAADGSVGRCSLYSAPAAESGFAATAAAGLPRSAAAAAEARLVGNADGSSSSSVARKSGGLSRYRASIGASRPLRSGCCMHSSSCCGQCSSVFGASCGSHLPACMQERRRCATICWPLDKVAVAPAAAAAAAEGSVHPAGVCPAAYADWLRKQRETAAAAAAACVTEAAARAASDVLSHYGSAAGGSTAVAAAAKAAATAAASAVAEVTEEPPLPLAADASSLALLPKPCFSHSKGGGGLKELQQPHLQLLQDSTAGSRSMRLQNCCCHLSPCMRPRGQRMQLQQ